MSTNFKPQRTRGIARFPCDSTAVEILLSDYLSPEIHYWTAILSFVCYIAMCIDFFYFIYLHVLYCHVKCAFCHIFNKEVNE